MIVVQTVLDPKLHYFLNGKISRHPTINPKSAAALGGMIEGRRAGWKARERALVYRLGAANKVTTK